MILKNFANIQSGRTFRTAIKSTPDGTFGVVQLRDIISRNGKPTVNWASTAKVNIESNRAIGCLQNGQLLVASKGDQKYIISLNDVPDNMVCSQHFLIIDVDEKKHVDVEFIEFILCSEFVQEWLEKRASGSYQSALTKSLLEQIPFPNLPIEQQLKAIELKKSIEKEMELLEILIDARLKQKNTLVSRWLQKDISNGQ
jgi:restriction endonuclease S subunit